MGLLLVLCAVGQTADSQKLKLAPKPIPAVSPPATVAPTPNTQIANPSPASEDTLGRTTPHGCVLGFLRSAEAKDYIKASQYLDGKRSPEQAQEIAIQLKSLLDHGLSTSIGDISRSPAGNIDDQLRLTRERVGIIKTPNGDLDVMLDLVNRPGEPAIWLFSQETLNAVPDAYASVSHMSYGRYFPAWTHVHIFSVPLWRWAVIIVFLAFTFGIATLLTHVTLWLLEKLFRKKIVLSIQNSVLTLKTPLFLLILALLGRIAGGYAITALGRHYWRTAAVAIAWISGAWLLARITDIIIQFIRFHLLMRSQMERVTFVSLMGRLFKILIGIVLLFALLTHAGINVSALLAGLGIGGIALALAAQKSLADLFGGLSIVMRGAVRVGDVCQTANIYGTIEDIGISALTLRTLDRSLVSIPNSKVAEVGLENFSLRDQFASRQLFTLRADTSHDTLKKLLKQINQLATAHPGSNGTTARARLIDLTPTGPQIEVYAYFQKPATDSETFLLQREELILKIISAIEVAETSLASPIGVMQMDHLLNTFQSAPHVAPKRTTE